MSFFKKPKQKDTEKSRKDGPRNPLGEDPKPFKNRKKGRVTGTSPSGLLAPSNSEVSSFLMTDPEEIEKERKRIEVNKSSSKIWMYELKLPKDGSPKLVYVKGRIGALQVHYVPKKTDSPKYPVIAEKQVCTESKKGSCAFCDAGFAIRLVHVWEFVDIEGYEDGEGDQHENVSCLYIVSDPRNDNFVSFISNVGEDSLMKHPFLISKSGKKTTTTHIYNIQRNERVSAKTVNSPSCIDKVKGFFEGLEYEDQEPLAMEGLKLQEKEKRKK